MSAERSVSSSPFPKPTMVEVGDESEHFNARLWRVVDAARAYRILVSPQYEGEEWEAAQELDAALKAVGKS